MDSEFGFHYNMSENQVNKIYRKACIKYHPDKIRGNEEKKESAKKVFEAIRTAYEIVGDKDKRLMFDTGGMELVKESEKKEQGGGAMDPFAAFFGGGGGVPGVLLSSAASLVSSTFFFFLLVIFPRYNEDISSFLIA